MAASGSGLLTRPGRTSAARTEQDAHATLETRPNQRSVRRSTRAICVPIGADSPVARLRYSGIPGRASGSERRDRCTGCRPCWRGNDFGVERRLWELLAFASGAAAAAACRRGMTVLWRVSRHEDPPENPASRGVRWRDALIWSISLGVGAAVSRLVAQRGAAAAWQAATGSQPPGLDDLAE